MFGGFKSVPGGKGPPEKPKLGIVNIPTVKPEKQRPGGTSSVPERVIRVKPGVAGAGMPVLGKVDASVAPERVGKDVTLGPRVVRPHNTGIYKYWASRADFERSKQLGTVGIRWVGPIFDESGYGEACRNYIAALASVGFPISAKAISFGEPTADYGLPGKMVMRVLDVGHACAINLIYSPPHYFKEHRDFNAYNIGMFVWEMNGLPGEWVSACNTMDEVWVPCEWNAKVAAASGVKVPIRVFGHTVAPNEYEGPSPLAIPNLDPSWYKFYSIFQWSTRKNPEGLLRSYLRAFTSKDPVILIMKTYGMNYSDAEEKKVKGKIEAIRREVGGSQPKILLVTKMLSKGQILGLHKLGDCFFLPHRAEGWGLPHFEACMSGKPVVTTNYGGNLEFTKPEHSYLIPSKQITVRGMDWFKWFTPNMTWAEADINSSIKILRHVYEHKDEAAQKGAMAKEYVTKAFNWMAIGSAIKGRILEILKGL